MMSRTRLALAATASLVLLAACSDDKKATPTTTQAPATTAPATTAPATTAPATTAPETTQAGGDIQFIDPMTLLTPWEGQTIQGVDATVADSLVTQMSAVPALARHLVAVGAITSIDDATGATSLFVFVEFDTPTDGVEADLYAGITDGGTDITDVTSGSHTGKAYLQGGMYNFASVFGTTAVIVMSDNADALQTSVDNMFAANPQL